MTWNYRIISHPPYGVVGNEGERTYQIHEVYTDEGKIIGFTEKGIEPFGESMDDLRQDFEYMKLAFTKPVLRVEDLEKASHFGESAGWGT